MNRYLVAAFGASLLIMWGAWQKIQAQAVAIESADKRIDTLERAAESRKNTQRLLAQLDTEHTQERERANQANANLRTAVATGERRLSVLATKCTAVRTAASPAGLDDAETRAELDPAAAERIVATTNDGDDAIRALTGLQDYINKVCRRGQ
ncbi:Bacteriophage lysis protein [compost metagenome]